MSVRRFPGGFPGTLRAEVHFTKTPQDRVLPMDCTTRSQLRVDPVVRWSFKERVKLILLRLNKQTLARPDIAGQWFNFMN